MHLLALTFQQSGIVYHWFKLLLLLTGWRKWFWISAYRTSTQQYIATRYKISHEPIAWLLQWKNLSSMDITFLALLSLGFFPLSAHRTNKILIWRVRDEGQRYNKESDNKETECGRMNPTWPCHILLILNILNLLRFHHSWNKRCCFRVQHILACFSLD